MLTTLSFAQDSPEEMKEEANKLFEKEQYVDATSLYLRILSLQPRSSDLNFRYGTCLLYNSNKKKDALKYLKYSVTDENVDPRAYFFNGRALHLDYQFEEARKQYQAYKNKTADKFDKRYDADRAIDMCNNGKKLLSTFTDIIVAEKQEIAEARFFDIYSDSKTIGGDILVGYQFQSKLDKKMGHTPIVHFPPNAKAIYYSSYGEDLETGKDIYISRKLPNGKWGEAQLLPGEVNTKEDEDYPYMHPSDNFLYFSSKGHNSMGGYDVFMSRYNHDNASFKTPENVDFAISSPDDDLFYVVDSLFQNAYFASARQSEAGKLHVYKVKVARVPIQEVIVMGEFISEVDPEKNGISVKLLTHSNGNDLDAIKSNAKGKYSYVFPQGGKYDYLITIDGTDEEYKFVVELPFMDEFRPLKQQILHTTNESGEEVIKIINLFDERVEGAESLIAQIIRKKSELNVNVNDIDLDRINAKKAKEEALANLGFKGMSMTEVADQLTMLETDVKQNAQTAERIEANLGEEVIIKSERIIELDKIGQELTKKANEASEPSLKYKLLNEAKQKQQEKELLIAQVEGLKELGSSVGTTSSDSGEKITAIKEQFKELIEQRDDEAALKLLVENKELIGDAKRTSPTGLIDEYIDKSVSTRAKIKKLKEDLSEYQMNEEQLKAQLRTLELRKSAAKKKELEKIKSEITSKEVELNSVQSGIQSTKKKIQTLEKDLNVTEEKMASLQNALATEMVPNIDQEKLEKAESDIQKIADVKPIDFDAQITRLEEEHPEVNGGEPIVKAKEVSEYINENKAEKARINEDPTLTEIEQTYRIIENDKATQEEISERLKQIDTQLESGTDPVLENEKEKLLEFSNELEGKIEQNKTKAKELKQSNPDVALSPEDVIEEVSPGHEDEIRKIEGDTGLTNEEKLEATVIEQRKLEGDVKKELEQVESILEDDPKDEEAKIRKEILEEILTTVGEDIVQTEKDIEKTSTSVAITGPTNEELINEVLPAYESSVEEIKNDPNRTPLEKEIALKEQEEDLLEEIQSKKKELEKIVKKNPDNEGAAQRLKSLEEIENETQGSIDNRNESIRTLEEGNPQVVETVIVKEDVINDVSPTYATTVEEIEGNPDSTPLEKEIALKQEEEKLLEEIQSKKKELEKIVKKNPDNEGATQRLKALEEIEAEMQASIDQREESIETLKTTDSPVANVTEAKQDVIRDIDPKYQAAKEEIENSDESPFKKKVRIASVEAGLLENLKKEEAELEKGIEKNPEGEDAVKRLVVVKQMIAEQESILDEIKAEGVESLTLAEKEEIITDLDPTYLEDILSASSPEEVAAREVELQDKIKKEIESLEKKQLRKYSVGVDLSMASLRKVLDESNKREEEAKSGNDVVETDSGRKEEFVEEVRGTLFEGDPEELTAEHTTKENLENQIDVLKAYEEAIEAKITEVEDQIEVASTPELEEELGWLKEEKVKVETKRRKASVSIGELETNTIASVPNTSTDDEVLTSLDKEEKAIEARLEQDVTPSEEKKLNKKLEEIQEDKKQRENELVLEEIEKDEEKGIELIKKVEEIEASNPDSPVASKVKEHYEKEDEEIDDLVVQAADADSEAEKKYLLEEAKKKRDDLNKGVQEVLAEQEVEKIEEDKGISLSSTEDLEKKKRRFTIGIGEIVREIAEVDEEIETAKKKDLPALETKRESLVAEKELLESRLESVNNKLKEGSEIEDVISPEAMKQSITFNEERKAAGSDDYKKYQPLAVEALKVENEITKLEDELEDERAGIQRLIIEGADSEAIEEKAERIKELESKIEELGLDLTQKKYLAEQALPENQEESMKLQNLVARGIKPLKTAVIATALFQLPTTGLAINTESEGANNGMVEIPVGVESPSGLVYRVQVGAFSKPIAPSVFKEFNPVSGEKISGTNITRYMAGFFNSSDDVVTARQDIRNLGYSDAFVVAYCDGERISFGEARRLESEGTCIPKGTNEIMIEVATKTAEKLGIPVSNEVQEVPELTYNQAPGAVEAEPIENMQGLFFTVQIGVFNRPVEDKELHYMPDVLTIRLPNGLIRYASGKFDSVEDAYPRQKYARDSGVNGAFITAYYNGERISIGNARKLLLANGKSILQSEIAKEKPVQEVVTPADIVRMDTVTNDVTDISAPMELWEHRVQIVTKKQFDVFPRDVLNRYNAEGSFYFDEKDRRVKSVIYKNADYLPRIWNFKDDVDTVYLPVGQLADTKTEIIGLAFSDSIIPGDFMDWMLRCNYRREIFKTYKGTEIRIFGVEDDDLQGMLDRIRLFGIEPKVIIETEDELELEENK